MEIAKYAKEEYDGELLTAAQWEKKGYVPKKDIEPHKMWPSKLSCTNSKKGPSDYYYDFEVEKRKN